MFRCPGQDQRFWKPEDIFEVQCPGCGKTIEFFKDEPKLKCHKCGRIVINPKIDLGCAEWCQYAEQCIGIDKAKNLKAIREELISCMKDVFGTDQKRIEHALTVLDYAEQIHNIEGGDPLIVRAAATLHDIGIHQAERKHNSSAGKYQEIEGPPIARGILEKQNISDEAIEHICKIIANHHSARDIDTIEFRIIWDADNIVNLSDDLNEVSNEKLQKIMNKRFMTVEGRRIAAELFVKT
ncbi:MAG: HD domain-containing protein [Sedimentisphaerales bacterium]|nr:HD domain-containing protein [Sedimentisphaerales bacterium]